MMTHSYKLSGLTCGSCVAKVKSELLRLPDVLGAEVTQQQAILSMERHIPLQLLQEAIGDRYSIAEETGPPSHAAMTEEAKRSLAVTYRPLLLVAAFITGVSLIAGRGDGMLWMNYFMAGFFLVFSFFKFLDLRGFADSYAMYDLLAKRVKAYGYIYPFLELALGLLFLAGIFPEATNVATIALMGFSSLGVIRSVVDKKQIRCACLGTVFNLPMSTVTIVEDLLMMAMAAATFIIQ